MGRRRHVAVTGEAKPRDLGQTAPAEPAAETVLCEVCRGHYIDTDPGRRAHRVVMGHEASEEGSE